MQNENLNDSIEILNQTLQDIATELNNLNYNIESVAQGLNRTDDFNNWTYADSLASIANAMVKANSLEKTKQMYEKLKTKKQVEY